MNAQVATSARQNMARILLGAAMVLAAVGHFTFQREAFRAQVPNWVPLGEDFIVLASGVVELALGLAMLFWRRQRASVGIALAVFFVLIFPGNLAQYLNGTDAFGLDTDNKRLARLFFQPVLIGAALWSTGAVKALRRKS